MTLRKRAVTTFQVVQVVLLAGVLPWLASVVAHWVFGAARYQQNSLHEAMELIGTCIALAVAMLLWLRSRHEEGPPHLLWVAAALVTMGLLDGLHAVLPFGIPWSWLRHGATLVGGLFFALVWVPPPAFALRRRQLFLASLTGLALAAAVAVCLRPDLMPAPFAPVGYTFAVKAANGLGGFGFVAAALFFLRRWTRRSHTEDLVFACQTLLFGAASLLFGFSHVWAADWWVWHGFRLLAYAVVLFTAYQVVVSVYLQNAWAAAIVSFSNDAIIGTTPDGTVTSWNAGAEKIYGYSAQEMIGHSITTIIPPDQLAEFNKMMQKIVRGEQVLHYETLRRRRNGEVFQVSLSMSPVKDESGKVVGVSTIARDITFRKRAEEQLRKASLYARSLLEASLDPLVTIRKDGKIMDVNQAAELATGVDREQLIGSDFSNYFTEPEKARAGYEQVFAAGTVRDYPLALRHTSGRVMEVLYNATLYKNEAGEVEGVFAAARDVTERNRAQTALTLERQRFRDVLDKLPVYVVLLTPDYHVSLDNTVFRQRFGESRGRRCYEFLFQRDTPCEICDTYKVLKTGSPQQWKWTGPDGRNYEIFDFPFTDTDGSPLILEMGLDVTERNQAELAMQRSEQRYRSLVVASSQIIWSTNPQGEVSGDMPMWREFTGQTVDEMQGGGWISTIHPDDRQRTAAVWSRAVKNRTLYDTDYRMRRRDGEYRYMAVRGVPVLEPDGSIREWIGTCTDITERRKAEEQIRQLNDELEHRVVERTAQLEASNRELEAFTYSVSHDLRAPLRHIAGFANMLAEEYEAKLDENAQHYVHRITDGVQRMGQLVDDLLNLARVGRKEVGLQVTGLSSIVQEVIADLKPEIEGRDIEWKVSSLPFVECDPALIKQVFQNLLSNAVKFSRPRAHAVIEVGQKEEDGRTVVFVRDNGVGFSMKYADKLFGVFQRLHRPEDFEGTGVGLATVQRIVAKHGGKVWANAELDKGATFYFSLGAGAVDLEKSKTAVAGAQS